MAVNVELNITLRCNQRCPNCNRLCNLFPEQTADVDLDAIDNFCYDTRAIPVKRVKLVGGEPTMHPEFIEIVEMLGMAVSEGGIGSVKIDTNGTRVLPDIDLPPGIRWSGRHPRKKRHLPVLWSPTDLGLPVKPCSMPRRCGFSLDSKGWLPCSMGIVLVEAFVLEHLYRDRLPAKVWGLPELCEHCIFAAPEEVRLEHCKPLNEITEAERTATPS